MARILISAYACEPNKGSEPEVGWQWVLNIAKVHEVWVLTKENNRETIEPYLNCAKDIPVNNIHFVYVGLPKSFTFWKKGNRGMRPYYYMWQRKAYKVAKELHCQVNFDLVHSVTFVSLTQPCFMYKLGIPFVWTVAGGENISQEINYPMKAKERLYEIIRKLGQVLSKYSWNTLRSLRSAKLILAATNETLELIPDWCKEKVIVTSAIGIEKKQKIKEYKDNNEVKVLLCGKFTYLKGVDIGIKAVLEVIEEYPNAKFVILGDGPREKQYKEMCKKYLGDRIIFMSKVPHEEMYEFYSKYDILLNTALRDSGCLTAMEAMSVGLPVVCIDTGGVKEMTESEFAVKVAPCKYEKLVHELAKGISNLIQDEKKRKQFGIKAYNHMNKKYLYENKALWLLDKYEKIILEEQND